MSQENIIANSNLVSGVLHSSNPEIANYLQESGLGIGFKAGSTIQLGAGLKVGPDSTKKLNISDIQLPNIASTQQSTSKTRF